MKQTPQEIEAERDRLAKALDANMDELTALNGVRCENAELRERAAASEVLLARAVETLKRIASVEIWPQDRMGFTGKALRVCRDLARSFLADAAKAGVKQPINQPRQTPGRWKNDRTREDQSPQSQVLCLRTPRLRLLADHRPGHSIAPVLPEVLGQGEGGTTDEVVRESKGSTMNAKRVCLEDGTKLDAWRCGECGLIYAGASQDFADNCCKCQECGISTNKPGEARRHLCLKCCGPHYAKKDAEKLERAEEIVGYDGPVVIDGDRYYSNVEELADERDGEDLPEFVFTCDRLHHTLDADDIIQQLDENAGLEEPVDFEGIAEFRTAVAAFNSANFHLEYWMPDEKHKVRVPKDSDTASPPSTSPVPDFPAPK